jgi:hypothetical protein
MRRTTLSLVLLLIVGLIPFGQGSLAVTQESEDKELRALLKSRREALKVIVANQHTRLHLGREGFSAYADLIIEMMHVDVELARSKQERIAVIEASLGILVDAEDRLEAQFKNGLSDSSEVLIAKADRLKVEIELHKAQKAP